MLFMFHVCRAFLSVHCNLVVNFSNGLATWLPLVCTVFLRFVTFPCGVLGQVWYFIVSIPDLCLLPYLGFFPL